MKLLYKTDVSRFRKKDFSQTAKAVHLIKETAINDAIYRICEII